MRHIIIFLSMIAVLLPACGNDFRPSSGQDDIAVVELVEPQGTLEVGTPKQLALKVTMISGEVIDDVKTEFVFSETDEELPVEWAVSDENVARIDGAARLIPRTAGFVTVSAHLGDVASARVFRVDDFNVPSYSGNPPPADEVEVEEVLPPEEPQTPEIIVQSCQGHAVGVLSFSPGSGAGFGGQDYPDIVLGPPEGVGDTHGSGDVLSLGRYGEIVLDLGDCKLVDGPGVDLLVFENPFFIAGDPLNPFAELAVVGVSDDGINFQEFDCHDANYPYEGCAGWNPVYSATSNSISPFDVVSAGGDGFDLSQIGVTEAHYVRIRDLEGYDGGGSITVGFDLDAISVVNGEMVQ